MSRSLQNFRVSAGGFTGGVHGRTDALAAASLLDEYRICTSPVINGGGESPNARQEPVRAGVTST